MTQDQSHLPADGATQLDHDSPMHQGFVEPAVADGRHDEATTVVPRVETLGPTPPPQRVTNRRAIIGLAIGLLLIVMVVGLSMTRGGAPRSTVTNPAPTATQPTLQAPQAQATAAQAPTVTLVPATNDRMATVSTEANHRSGPGTGYQSFGVVYGNPTVKMLARNDNPSEIWLKVELPDGRIAWMARSVLLANDSDIETLSVEIVPAPTAAPAATQASAAQQAQAQPAGRLAVQRKDGTNDEATCLAFEVIGQNATGWSVKVDGTRLSGVFDQRNARLCGLSPNQEVTFSIYFANGDRVPGGRGVPARGGEVFSGYWTR